MNFDTASIGSGATIQSFHFNQSKDGILNRAIILQNANIVCSLREAARIFDEINYSLMHKSSDTIQETVIDVEKAEGFIQSIKDALERLVPKELVEGLELVLNITQITDTIATWILNCLKCKVSKRATVTEFAYPIVKENGVGWISFKFQNKAKRRKFLTFDHQVMKIHYERRYFWFDQVEDFFAATDQAKNELMYRRFPTKH